jgi:hypothetical protein
MEQTAVCDSSAEHEVLSTQPPNSSHFFAEAKKARAELRFCCAPERFAVLVAPLFARRQKEGGIWGAVLSEWNELSTQSTPSGGEQF